MKIRNLVLASSFVLAVITLTRFALAKPQKRPSSERSWDYTLDVVFEGPLGLVKYTDGHVEVYVADVEPHDYAFVQGLNDCELAGTDYKLDIPSSILDTTPDTNLDTNLKVQWNNKIQIDPASLHFAYFRLPQPYQIKAAHLDPTAVSEKPFPNGGPEPKYTSYPTSIVLRYKMQASDPPITISTLDSTAPNPCNGTTQAATLMPQVFDKEHFLKIGVGPDALEDKAHTHAMHAFKNEIAMFPALKRFAKFPDPTSSRFRATDCRAPVVLITDAQ